MPGYFSYIPNIAYEERPLKYPFSVADTVIAKNFFKRFKLNDEIFDYVVYFNKYSKYVITCIKYVCKYIK